MSWDYLPIVSGSDITKDIFNDIRIGINERAVLVGTSQIPTVSATGDWLDAGSIFNGTDRNITTYQSRIEQLIPHFWDETNSIPFTKVNLFTQQGIGNGSDWSRVPGTSYGQMQDNDDIYKEIFNEMKLALDGLTKAIVPANSSLIFGKTRHESHDETGVHNSYETYRSDFITNYNSQTDPIGSVSTSPIAYDEYGSHFHIYLLRAHLATGMDSVVNTVTIDQDVLFLGFPSSGQIRIENEVISYSSVSGSSFLGCTRGASGTTATSHSPAVGVYAYGISNMRYTSDFTKLGIRRSWRFPTSNLGGLSIISARLFFNISDYASPDPSRSNALQIWKSSSLTWSVSSLSASHNVTMDSDIVISIPNGHVETLASTFFVFKWGDDGNSLLTIRTTDTISNLLTSGDTEGNFSDELIDSTDSPSCRINGHSVAGGSLILDIGFLKRS